MFTNLQFTLTNKTGLKPLKLIFNFSVINEVTTKELEALSINDIELILIDQQDLYSSAEIEKLKTKLVELKTEEKRNPQKMDDDGYYGSCCSCNAKEQPGNTSFISIRGKVYCPDCAEELFNNEISLVPITTTNNIDGYCVTKYISVESSEIIMGTGMISEFMGEISDIFGARSTAFEEKLEMSRKCVILKLQKIAYEKEADAIIGVDIDYTEFSGNRIGVIANGTLVKLKKSI